MDMPVGEHYYLPVHAVFKASSTTKKIRPVFDAFAKTWFGRGSGRSLNDTLLATPSLHPHIFSLLTVFRSYPVALIADVGKIFREIALEP